MSKRDLRACRNCTAAVYHADSGLWWCSVRNEIKEGRTWPCAQYVNRNRFEVRNNVDNKK